MESESIVLTDESGDGVALATGVERIEGREGFGEALAPGWRTTLTADSDSGTGFEFGNVGMEHTGYGERSHA
jgi:hypothetical protein